MPSLNAAQKQQVAAWVNEGLSLSDVQKRIAADLGVSMTYMDVRFLVDDLDLTLVDKAPPAPAPKASAETPASAASDLPGDVVEPTPEPEGLAPEAPAGGGSVKVTVDPIQRPGVLVSGTVSFSDGQGGQWQMDEYGRLGFVPPYAGYKPAPADVQAFQTALDAELRKLGF